MTSSILEKEKINGRYCVVIPAYQAEKTVGPLIRQVKALSFDVVVVNDGSSDGTTSVASKEAAVVISHLNNQGKGAALKTGFDYARRMGYDGVITLDSDGQHDPQDILLLIRAGEVQHAGLVLGNRMGHGLGMPHLRWQVNRVMSLLVSALVGQRIPDSQCGFRMIRKEVLESVPMRAKRFDMETELVLRASRKRWKIISVAVKTIYDKKNTSHIRPIQDGLRFIGLILRHVISFGK